MDTPAEPLKSPPPFPWIWLIGVSLLIGGVVSPVAVALASYRSETPWRWMEGIELCEFGLYTGLFALTAIWAVFGPDKFHKQWLVAGLVLAMVTLARRAVSAWIFGFLGWNVWPYMYHVRGVRVAQAYLLPFYWTAMQMPLWGWRLGAGWRIVRASDAASPTAAQSRQVSMYDFLGMILLVGVLFNLARLGTSHWSNFVEPCGTLEETLWLAAWLMLASLLFLPSCVFVSLASDRWQRTLAGQTLVVALGPIALMILRVLIHTWQAWSWRFSWLHQLVSSSMPSLGGLLTVFAVLWLARRSGYRLIWIRRQVAESLRDSKPLRVTE